MKHCSLFVSLFMAIGLVAQNKPSQEWLDRKYSMFIHFGIYSVYGGVYDGKPVTRGYSEQIQSFAGIFSDWYGNTAGRFNPIHWNPDSIVALAKNAGMGSIVFTSKHHDGFCMYHSAYTDFNVVEATPYGRDLMKELSEACKRGGIGFGVYYSLIDWHFPQAYPISSHNADPITPEHYSYNLKQVEEIMTNYGPLSEIWFDMGSLTPAQSKGLYELVDRLQPNCMISGRLGNDYVDFSVMADNEYPDYMIGVPWQTAASMFNETWSYRSWQERGEVQPKVKEKIESLIKVISRGGNYLLNIGPKGDGSIVEFEREVLLEMGKWVKANSEAIYATRANPFHQPFDWGDITAKDNCLFAFVENIPASKKITLSGFKGKIIGVTSLSSQNQLSYTQHSNRLDIDITSVSEEKYIPVVKITFDQGYNIIPSQVISDRLLTPRNAVSLFGHSSLNYYGGYKSVIGYDWVFDSRKRTVTPQITFTDNEKGSIIEMEVDGRKQTVTLDPERFETKRLPENSVVWGNLYRKPGRGVFGNVEEEGIQLVDVDREGSPWTAVKEFPYGKIITEMILPIGGIVFLQEIESTLEQNVAVMIGSGNATYIQLNGVYITAHFSPERIKQQEEIVLLPLKKGRNQLIIKFYNGYEKEISFGITPLDAWTIYSRNLTPISLERGSQHRFSIRSADSPSTVSPMRMNNISVILR